MIPNRRPQNFWRPRVVLCEQSSPGLTDDWPDYEGWIIELYWLGLSFAVTFGKADR